MFGGVGLVVIALIATIAIVSTTGGNGGGGTGGGGGTPPPPDDLGSSVPITVEGNQLMRNGQPWWFLGYNSFVWSGNCGNEDERMSTEQVDEWFSSMRQDGHGAVRLFFFEGWDQERLDHAVESARANNLYLIITLDDALSNCGERAVDSSWFDDQEQRDAYQAHMTDLLERYRGETTIAAFEYFNEPGGVDGRVREFYDEMGAVADEIDPDRLFSSGTIAPYSVGSDDDYLNIHESPGVDIASLHEYDENEIESNHGDDARSQSAGKPVLVGEFGIRANETGEDCDFDFAARAEQFRGKVEAYTTIEGYAGGLAWAWQPEGGSECAHGTLDVDQETQSVLRDWTPNS